MRPRVQRQRRCPNRVPLTTDVDLTERSPHPVSPYRPYTTPPLRSLTTTVRHPPALDGRTHASTVIPDDRSNELESGTVTQSFTPSKLNPDPNRPAILHTAPDTVPTFPRPDESTTLEPELAFSPYAATGRLPAVAAAEDRLR